MKKILSLLIILATCQQIAVGAERYVDYRYAPKWFESSICFPDDSYKTIVGTDGQLLYGFAGGSYFPYANDIGVSTVIQILADENVKFQGQQLETAKIPATITSSSVYGMQVRQRTFATAGFLFDHTTPKHPLASDREDIVCGTELHLLEGIPQEWLGAGMTTSLQGIATPFGLLTMRLTVGKSGRSAKLTVEPLGDKSCTALVVHTGDWTGGKENATITLDPSVRNELTIKLK